MDFLWARQDTPAPDAPAGECHPSMGRATYIFSNLNKQWARQDTPVPDVSAGENHPSMGRATHIFSNLIKRWARQDSNLRPSGYEPCALPLQGPLWGLF